LLSSKITKGVDVYGKTERRVRRCPKGGRTHFGRGAVRLGDLEGAFGMPVAGIPRAASVP